MEVAVDRLRAADLIAAESKGPRKRVGLYWHVPVLKCKGDDPHEAVETGANAASGLLCWDE